MMDLDEDEEIGDDFENLYKGADFKKWYANLTFKKSKKNT